VLYLQKNVAMRGIGWPVRAGVFERAGVFDRTLVTFRVCLPNEADTPELLFHVSIEPKAELQGSCGAGEVQALHSWNYSMALFIYVIEVETRIDFDLKKLGFRNPTVGRSWQDLFFQLSIASFCSERAWC
jgi:hypothetical protein